MALRLRDDPALAHAAALASQLGSPGVSRVTAAGHAWIDALTGSHDHIAVEAVADDLEERGYSLQAADARADAALLATRAGLSTEAGEWALEFYARIGARPRLGPLPETRWLATVVESA